MALRTNNKIHALNNICITPSAFETKRFRAGKRSRTAEPPQCCSALRYSAWGIWRPWCSPPTRSVSLSAPPACAAHPSARQGRECESCRSGCGTIYMYMYLRLMAYQIKYIWGPKVVLVYCSSINASSTGYKYMQ